MYTFFLARDEKEPYITDRYIVASHYNMFISIDNQSEVVIVSMQLNLSQFTTKHNGMKSVRKIMLRQYFMLGELVYLEN